MVSAMAPLALSEKRNHFRYCIPFVEIWILSYARMSYSGLQLSLPLQLPFRDRLIFPPAFFTRPSN